MTAVTEAKKKKCNMLYVGELFPGTREEILGYMAAVGYTHIPGGHQAGVIGFTVYIHSSATFSTVCALYT